MKGKIFELEERVKDIRYLEEKNKELLEDNLALVKLKNEAEYELNSFEEKNIVMMNNLKEEIAMLQDDNAEKKNVNRSLYEENINLKSENTKLLDEINELNQDIKEFNKHKKQLESTLHNISKALIESQDENSKFNKQENLLCSLNRQYYLKRYEEWHKDTKYTTYDNDTLVNENGQLKKNILLIMNQNYSVLSILYNTI